MGELTIKSDRKWRNLAFRGDVPTNILETEFDWLSEDEGGDDGFFQYRGHWYHLSEFIAIGTMPFKSWDGYLSDSYFSGVLIRTSEDGEQYQIGRYYS